MGIIKRLFGKRKIYGNIVFLGASRSGKTTFIRFLETEKPVLEKTTSTVGMSYRKKNIDLGEGIKVRAIDVGGQSDYQEIEWLIGVENAIGIIFIIDATLSKSTIGESGRDLYVDSLNAFNYFLTFAPIGQIPILVVLNKQDLPEAMKYEEIKNHYKELEALMSKNYTKALECSAKYGDGVYDAMNWFKETFSQLSS